jgi:hypothetical protein
MGRRTGPIAARRRLAAAGLLCLCVAGCGGHSYVQASSSGSPATGVSSGGSVSVQGRNTVGALLMIGIFAGASSHSGQAMPPTAPVPELDPTRRVAEQDCTKPIEDWSANLRCR